MHAVASMPSSRVIDLTFEFKMTREERPCWGLKLRNHVRGYINKNRRQLKSAAVFMFSGRLERRSHTIHVGLVPVSTVRLWHTKTLQHHHCLCNAGTVFEHADVG